MKKTLLAAAVLMFAASSAFAAQSQTQVGKKAVRKANAAVAADRAAMTTRGVQTTDTDVYDVTKTNKKGTVNYGVVQQTTTGPLGTAKDGGIAYATYSPSKAALTNEKDAEMSFAAGGSYSFNNDNRSDRYAKTGFAAGANVLWKMDPHFGLGFDYMFLNPDGRKYDKEDTVRSYHRIRAHNIALAGKYTLNVWDNWRVYIPMGAGMMNLRMKTDSTAGNTSRDKWGASVYGGLGLQYDISSDVFIGLEYRYIYAFVSDKHLSDYGRDSNFQFHNAFLRLGMRF